MVNVDEDVSPEIFPCIVVATGEEVFTVIVAFPLRETLPINDVIPSFAISWRKLPETDSEAAFTVWFMTKFPPVATSTSPLRSA